jgi:hypothetical protein
MKKSLTGNKVHTQDSNEIAKIKEENMKFIEKDIRDWEHTRFLVFHNCNPFPFNIGEVLKKSKRESERAIALQRSTK